MLRWSIVFALLILGSFAETKFYRLTWEKDPATTITVGFKQSEDKGATVYYDTVDHGENAEAYKFKKDSSKSTEHRGTVSQFAYLTDLKPDTKYYFVVKDADSISKRFYFITAPNRPKKFRFIAGGDSRSSSKNRRKSNILVPTLRPLFVLFNGDFTGSGSSKQWTQWLTDWELTYSEDGRLYPVIPVRGNHDKKGGVAAVWGLEDTKEYYSISFAANTLLVYNLNTEISTGGDQVKWFKEDLEKNAAKARYIVAGYHKPIRPHVAGKREGVGQYKDWTPLFYEYKFDLLTEADAHCVKRTARVKPSSEPGNDEGFVTAEDGFFMTGEGCWGAPLRKAEDVKSWTLGADKFNSFDVIDVYADRMDLRTVNSDESKDVEAITEKDGVFALPKGMIFWQPKSGEVLKIKVRKK